MTTLGSLVLHAVKGPVHVSRQALTLPQHQYDLATSRLAKVHGSDQTATLCDFYHFDIVYFYVPRTISKYIVY